MITIYSQNGSGLSTAGTVLVMAVLSASLGAMIFLLVS
jgi:hypothetical protein